MKEFYLNYLKENLPFWMLTIAAILLLGISLFIPPKGIIDASVIAATGELLGFGALWVVVLAITKGRKASLKHNNTEITLDKEE